MPSIASGSKVMEVQLGYSVALCESCRTLRPVLVRTASSHNHPGTVAGDESRDAEASAECVECGFEFAVDRARYASFVDSPAPDLDALARSTLADPGTSIPKSPPPATDTKGAKRVEAIDRAFSLATAFATLRMRKGIALTRRQVRTTTVAALLVVIAAGILIYLAGHANRSGKRELGQYYGGAAAALITVAAIAGLAPVLTMRRRFVNAQLLPHLARLLAPYRPTRDELVVRLSAARKGDPLMVWAYLTPARLATEVLKVRVGPSRPADGRSGPVDSSR